MNSINEARDVAGKAIVADRGGDVYRAVKWYLRAIELLCKSMQSNTLPERTKTNAWRKVLEYVHRVETLRASKASTSRTAVEEESSDLQARIEALGKESVLSLSAERERTDDNLASKVTELSGKRELVTNMSVPTKEEGLKQDLALAHQFFDIMSKQPVAYMDKPREQARFEDRLESNETVEDLLEQARTASVLHNLNESSNRTVIAPLDEAQDGPNGDFAWKEDYPSSSSSDAESSSFSSDDEDEDRISIGS